MIQILMKPVNQDKKLMIDIKKIRGDFPILSKEVHGKPLVYLDNAATTQKPKAVLEAIIKFYTEYNSNIHRGVHFLGEQASNGYEKAREKVKNFVNAANITEIIFTSGTTGSINLVANSFGESFINEGDEIIISEMEHHSNIVPWQLICERKGAFLKVIPFNNDGLLQVDAVKTLITSKTKLISLIYVSNVLGVINPVKKIIELAHSYDIPVLIDGAQAVQHIPIDVQELDCDFFAFSGHKIYAETGIGVLYGKEKWLEKMPPYQCGGGMISSVSFENTSYADLPFKFEAGTNNYVAALSLGTAIDYLKTIRISNIAAYEQEVYDYAILSLSDIEGLTIFGNAPQRCGSISFNLESIHPYDAGMLLDKSGIAIRTGNHCAEPVMKHYGIGGTIRASFALYNTIEEINELIKGIHKAQKVLS